MKTGSVLNMNKKENMEFLAVFCQFLECKTRVHGWLAKPLLSFPSALHEIKSNV